MIFTKVTVIQICKEMKGIKIIYITPKVAHNSGNMTAKTILTRIIFQQNFMKVKLCQKIIFKKKWRFEIKNVKLNQNEEEEEEEEEILDYNKVKKYYKSEICTNQIK